MAKSPVNLVRCPRLKITSVEVLDSGEIQIREDFNTCYKKYCAAWNTLTKSCTLYTSETEETDEDDDDSDS